MVQLIVSWYDATDQTQLTKSRQKSRTSQPLPTGIRPRFHHHRHLLVPTCAFKLKARGLVKEISNQKAAAQHHVNEN
jgi:hypothetical protein